MLSHKNIVSNMKSLRELRAMAGEDITTKIRSLAYIPWSHCFGLVVELHVLVAHGSAMGIVNRREDIIDSFDLVKPTFVASVPALMNRVYDGVYHKVQLASPLRKRLFEKAMHIARDRNHRLEYGLPVSPWLSFMHSVADALVMSKIRAKLMGGRDRKSVV